MALSADKIIELYKKGLADGSITTMEPLLSLFMLENNPMSLIGREPMLPLFKTERPKRMTLQAGRQVSKSMNIGALSILGAGFASMQVAIFEPRFTQKRAINTQILSPLLRNCVVSDRLIRPSNIDTLDVKKMMSGGNIFIVNSILTGDQARGISGIGLCMIDESIARNECVCVYDDRTNKHISRKISQIKAGDILTSFNDGCILYSVATRDASFHGHKQCYKVTLSSGRTLTCTSSHLLPTSVGKMRLEEVIEYVYQRTVIKSGERGRIFTDSAERNNGILAGGWLSAGVGEDNKGITLEPEPETARVQFTQVPAITRARYERTANRTESRLRRLLVCVDAEEFKNVSLVVRTDAPECCQDEDSNSGVLEHDRSPHRTGLVVSRRRVKNCCKKLRRYRNQWVFSGRGEPSIRLVEDYMECGGCGHSGESLKYREAGAYNQAESGSLSDVCGSCSGVCASVHAIQDGQGNEQLSALWEGDNNNRGCVLLGGMSRGASPGDDKGLQFTNRRATEGSFQRMEESESGEGGSKPQEVLRSSQRRDTGTESGILKTVSARASRGVQSEEERVASSTQGRSRTQSKEGCSRQGVPRATEVRSREVSGIQGKEGGESKSTKKYPGGEAARAGKTTCISCCCSSRSRKVRQIFRSSQKVQEVEEGSKPVITAQPAAYSYDPIVSIEYVGYDDVYDIEVVGTHNYILANGICSYNCQDMVPSNIPVLEAVADAKVDTGFRIYSGTAKTLDGSLALKFEQSSQGHWCVKCVCGKYNIFAPEEQLFTTIRDIGCCCSFCGRVLNCATGGYIHKFPSRVFEHPGYHLPQTIFPFHHTPNAWKEIIYKKNSLPKTQFYNEVLGVSDSDSARLLTKADLLAARNNVKTKEQGLSLRSHYDLVVLGVDWGGGGGGESATGIAVIAKSFNTNHFEMLYLRRLPTGLTPEQEASIVESVASDFRVDLIAHDYTGAGFMREAFFVQAYPEWRSALFPVSYSFKPNADLVTSSASGSRASYTIDKSKSLLLTMSCIKHGVLTVPWFDPLDAAAPQLDFLAIVEHKNKLEDVEGNVVQRRSEVYLLDKVAGVRDDAAQAANIGFIAACHTLGQYPVISYDSKFDITEEQRKLLLGE